MSSLEHLYSCEGQHSQLRQQDDVVNSRSPYNHLPPCRNFTTYPEDLRRVLRPSCKSLLGKRLSKVLPALHSEPFLGGAAPVGTCPGSYREVRCSATTLQPPYLRFSLRQSGRFLSRHDSCTCTPDSPPCPGAPSGNGPKTTLWSLVGFVPTYYTYTQSPMSRPYFLSSPIVLLVQFTHALPP